MKCTMLCISGAFNVSELEEATGIIDTYTERSAYNIYPGMNVPDYNHL